MTVPALTQFRMFLDRLDPSDREDQLRFFRLLAMAGEEGLEDIRTRLLKSSTARELRFLYVEAAFYYPCKEWLAILPPLLRRETDPAVFTVGVWALGRSGPKALEALKNLYTTCTDPNFKETLSEEILRTDPQQAFSYHLQHLMEGSSNTRMANEAVIELGKLVGPEHLPTLTALIRHDDLLIARHALKLASLLRTKEAGQFFVNYLKKTHEEILSDRSLKELLASLKTVPSAALQETITPHLEEHFGKKCSDELHGLASADPSVRLEALAKLRLKAGNFLENFLVDALALVLEARLNQWPTLVMNAGDAHHQRSRQAAFTIDTCAQVLGAMVGQGLVERPAALAEIKEAYREQTGREGMARVFGDLVEAGDPAGLALLFAGQDGNLRAAALDALGLRGEAELMPYLIRACRDPIVETAQRAMLAVGRMPGAAEAVLKLLKSANPDEARLGLDIAAANKTQEVVPDVLRLLEDSTRDDTTIAITEALGLIGDEKAVPALLTLLHSGQSQRLQIALATALRDLGGDQAVLGLVEHANQLRNVQIHLLAAEGLIRAHSGPEHPLSVQEAALLRQQIQECWEDKNPWDTRHRLIVALQPVWSEDPVFLQDMAALITSCLADKRCQAVWSAQDQATAKVIARELVSRVTTV